MCRHADGHTAAFHHLPNEFLSVSVQLSIEDAVERELSALMHAILAGYHKKQVWIHKIWTGINIQPVRSAGCQHGRVPQAVEKGTTGTDVWVEGRGAEAETNLLIDEQRARIEFGKPREATCRAVQ